MKKKVLTIALAVALIAILVSGSLAYFTAEDKVDNTFTIGSVLVEIFENNTATASDTLEFKKPLTPIVNTGNPGADEGYIHKAVKVQCTGQNPAYIRIHIAVPKALVGYLILDVDTASGWEQVAASEATKDGVTYTVYTYDYTHKVDPNAFTTDVLKGVYLADSVDIKDNPDTPSADLEFCRPNGDGTYTFSGYVSHNKVTGGYNCTIVDVLVFSQAIQAQSFEKGATNALDTGFGQGKNPWQ